MKRVWWLPVLLLLTPALSGCRYNMYPLIPKSAQQKLELPIKIGEASLVRQGDTLLLKAKIEGRFEAGYMKVSWFNSFERLGEDNVYLDADQRSAEYRFQAPAKGAYRATLSFGGKVLRQVELYEVKP